MVRVLAVADEEVPTFESRARGLDVDLVVSAGDLPWDYLERLVELLDVPGVFVPGNHEPSSGRGAPRGMTSADDRVVEVAGLRLGGLGGCVRYNGGPHQYTQAEYVRRADRLVARLGDGRLDVLLTHAPPFRLGDEPDAAHVGVEAWHDLLERTAPRWHLHGHIHPYGLAKPDRQVGDTTVRNVVPWTVMDVEPGTVLVGDRRESTW